MLLWVSVIVGKCWNIQMFWGRKLHTTPKSPSLIRNEQNGPYPTRVEIWMIDMHTHTHTYVGKFLASDLMASSVEHTHTHMYILMQTTVGFCQDFQLCMCACKGRATCESHGQWIRHLNTRCAGSCLTQKGRCESQITIILPYKNNQLQRSWQWQQQLLHQKRQAWESSAGSRAESWSFPPCSSVATLLYNYTWESWHHHVWCISIHGSPQLTWLICMEAMEAQNFQRGKCLRL